MKTFIKLFSLALILLSLPSLVHGQEQGNTQGPPPAAPPPVVTADQIQWLGRDSCAANTCHGGPIGKRVEWNSSLTIFEAFDPHASAGLTLTSSLSRTIIEAIEPGLRNRSPAGSVEASNQGLFAKVLRDRCAGCHAPGLADAYRNRTTLEGSALIVEGVSCESCHGPARQWLEPHLQHGWPGGDGLRNNKDYVARVEGCVSCHVGGRSQDGIVRDMNHDMIAAGHPALRFDAWSYLDRLPKHWEHHNQAADGIPRDGKTDSLRRLRTGRLVSLKAATELTAERIKAATSNSDSQAVSDVVWPEFADFDCFACHQNLSVNASGFEERAERRDRLVAPRYNPWLETGTTELFVRPNYSPDAVESYESLQNSLRMDIRNDSLNPDKYTNQLALKKRLLVTLIEKEKSAAPEKKIAGASSMGPAEDWYDAAIWFLVTQAEITKNDKAPEAEFAEKLERIFRQLEFGRSNIGVRGGVLRSPAYFSVQSFRDLQNLHFPNYQPKTEP